MNFNSNTRSSRYNGSLSGIDRLTKSHQLMNPKDEAATEEPAVMQERPHDDHSESLEQQLIDAARDFPELLGAVDLSDESIACIPELQVLADLKQELGPTQDDKPTQ